MVPRERASAAMAGDARSVQGAGVGGDAAADAGLSRGGLLRAVPEAVPDARCPRKSISGSSARGVGGVGLLRTREEPPCSVASGEGAAIRAVTTADASRCGSLYGRRRGVIRLRATRRPGRYERRACFTAGLRPARGSQNESGAEEDLGACPSCASTHRESDVDTQSGPHGARCAGVHRSHRALRGLSSRSAMQIGAHGQTATPLTNSPELNGLYDNKTATPLTNSCELKRIDCTKKQSSSSK